MTPFAVVRDRRYGHGMAADGRRHVVAIGGGMLMPREGTTPYHVEYAIKLSGKAAPRLCVLNQAVGDDPAYYLRFYDRLANSPAEVRHLSLFPMPNVEDPEDFLLSQDIIFVGNDAPNFYDSLQTKVEKRFSGGLELIAHYTFAKSLDHDRDYWVIDPRVGYGPDDYNRKHVFSFSSVYELPIGRGKHFMGNANRVLDLLIGGYQLTTTTNWSSGLPWTPSYNECSSDIDTGPCRPILVGHLSSSVGHFDPVAGSVPFYTPVPTLANNGDTNGAFQRPQKGTFGSGRNPFTGPRFFNSDLSLFKNFTITEQVKGQFRFEAFNVFNKVNLGNPNNCVDCSGGGVINGLAPNASMRQLDFGVKFTF